MIGSFKKFESDAITSVQRELVTAPLWSNSNATLMQVYTSSEQPSSQKEYYYDVYNSQSNAIGSEVQFAVTFGDLIGSGSSTGSIGQNLYHYPTKAIYTQYRQLLLTNGQNLFTFKNDETSEYVYIININRDRFRDRMDTNTWQLNLAKLDANGKHPTSSSEIINLIDDSTRSTLEYAQQGGRVFNIRSGSLANGIYTSDTTAWGLFYPDNGMIVLNGKALDVSASFVTRRSPVTASGDSSALKLFTSISGALAISSSFAFQSRTSEVINSRYYFVRMLNDEFNYTNNNSFFTGSLNIIKNTSMYDDPQVYVTTVGMYDNDLNLLAVAKLSKPIKKTFDREVVLKVKLDY